MDAIVLGGLVALLVVVAALLVRGLLAGETQEVARTVQCPVHDRPADCVLVRDVRTGRLTAVARCSLREPATAPCSAECARLIEAGAELKPGEAPRARRPSR
jgi:hypothetical protein